MQPRGVAILGSTGSVGRATLDVIARHPNRFRVTALTAHRNVALLAEQCVQFRPGLAVVGEEADAEALQAQLREAGCDTRVAAGPEALRSAVEGEDSELIMAAIVGAAGLDPALHAARCGKRLLLANKESMVIAGALFARAVREQGAKIIPVDSEHNALFQALPDGFDGSLEDAGVERLILTASGGPFLEADAAGLSGVTPEQACDHPNWDMGPKISVDSATLMNKGLEVIEARWLFDARPDQISVLVHPQSVVHSMVAYRDGSVIAQLGMPDMRTPIAHALAWPERIEAGVARLHLHQLDKLEFRQPDPERFPCLRLAFEALESGGNAAIILNAANECAVQAFLDRRISFMDIPRLVGRTLEMAAWSEVVNLEDVLEFDRMARTITQQELGTMGRHNA
ncbi:MAG: 1-deoxy-D-xylulose-5-phosphate reductoisomerase [Xanthomonadales bacterium]|nr:1-deoxy-D-xylulose-5-phosphate reductoisomerase [Xanthomonadales bacterium]